MLLKGRNLVKSEDFSVEEIDQILSLSQNIIENPSKYSRVCEGKLLATLFYEPSTRTRLSFEAAMLELGGSVLGFSSADSPPSLSVLPHSSSSALPSPKLRCGSADTHPARTFHKWCTAPAERSGSAPARLHPKQPMPFRIHPHPAARTAPLTVPFHPPRSFEAEFRRDG